MTFWGHIGTFIAIPFLALSAWFVGGADRWAPHWLAATSTPPAATSTAPAATSTPTHTQPTQPSHPTSGAVELYSVSQTTNLNVGTKITLAGSGFTADNTILLDGMAAAKNVHLSSVTNGHQTIEFTIPSSVGPDCKAGEMCPMYLRLLTTGTYPLSVENENGVSNAINVSIVAASIQ
ncbi:MAG TPA: hypothetical protein VG934_00355 [Candidatus Paceibacterota bacterium]|nr:hypothetical protein [Candidatus Paceibacterota bacterium]